MPTSFPLPFLLTILTLLAQIAFSGPIELQQKQTLPYEFEIENSISLDLEELSNLNQLIRTTLYNTSTCSIKQSYFSLYERIPYRGLVGSHHISFTYENKYFVFELIAARSEAYIIICDLIGVDTNPPQKYLATKTKRVYNEYAVRSHEIRKMRTFDKYYIFGTTVELLFYQFQGAVMPDLKLGLGIDDYSIVDFELVGLETLYVANRFALLIYDIKDIGNKHVKKLAEYSTYMTQGSYKHDIVNLRAIAVCENIIFLAHGTNVLIIRQNEEMLRWEKLEATKVIDMTTTVLQMIKVGRSLVILTMDGLVEYIFVNDCMDLQMNFFMPFGELGFASMISSEDTRDYVELKGDPNSSYFMVLNKLKDRIYVFQSAAIPGAQAKPYMYTLSDPVMRILSAEISEKRNENDQVEVMVTVKQRNEVMVMIRLDKVPAQLSCSNWLPKREALVVDVEARFCNNSMYNYTQEKQKPGVFDPNQMCVRNLEIQLHYKWPQILTIAIAVAALACISVVVIIVVCLRRKKRKQEKKPNDVKLKHVRFQSEDLRIDLNQWNNSEGVYDPYSSPMSSHRYLRTAETVTFRNERWRSFSDKRGLTIRVPRYYDGKKFVSNYHVPS